MAEDQAESSSPVRKRAKLENSDIPATQGETSNCPICLDSWSSTGTHRLVSLKCGHLFGQICVEKWLTSHFKCPQCNGVAKKSDIRPIYAKTIYAVDNEERDSAQRLYEAERIRRTLLEQAHLKTSMQCQLFASENAVMKRKIWELENRLKTTTEVRSMAKSLSEHGCYSFSRSILVSTEKKPHVFHSDPHTGMIAVSKKFEDNHNQHGVLKISSIDASHHEFVNLHSNQIRDIKFDHFGNTTLLSCSKSKNVMITCLKSNNTVITYPAPRDCWSCTWHCHKDHIIYTGLNNGEVMVFDIRNTKESLESIMPVENIKKCPIISVVSLPGETSDVLVSSLMTVSHHKKTSEGNYHGELLGIPPGAISSVAYDSNSSNLLVSYKPVLGTKGSSEQHVLMKLTDSKETGMQTEIINTFKGGSTQALRCRSSLISCPDDDNHLLVCLGEQESNSIKIWSTKNMKMFQQFPIKKDESGPIIAVGPHRAAGTDYLCGLTNQRIVQYKWLLSESHFENNSVAYQFDVPN